MGRKTINNIRAAVGAGKLPREFTPTRVNAALNITWAGTFLPKHRAGNPGNNTELFIRIRNGLYKLNTEQEA